METRIKTRTEIKEELIRELYTFRVSNDLKKVESLLKSLDEKDLYDDVGMPLVHVPILQNKKSLLELFMKFQPCHDKLVIAVEFGNFDIAEMICDKYSKLEETMMEHALEFYAKDKFLLMNLITSIFYSRYPVEWIRFFKKKGMDFNYQYEPFGETALHMLHTIAGANPEKARVIFDTLVRECKVNVNIQDRAFKFSCIMNLGVDFIEPYVNAGGDLDLVDYSGKIFLDYYVHKLVSNRYLLRLCMMHMTRISAYSNLIVGNIWDEIVLEKKRAAFQNLFLD